MIKVKIGISDCLEQVAIKVANWVAYSDSTWCSWLIGEPKFSEELIEMKRIVEGNKI